MITARQELYDHLKYLVEPDEANQMIEEYRQEVIESFYKVYEINSTGPYIGKSFVAAKDANDANLYISAFKDVDKDNSMDSVGYCFVTEDDEIETCFGIEPGIFNYGIHFVR